MINLALLVRSDSFRCLSSPFLRLTFGLSEAVSSGCAYCLREVPDFYFLFLNFSCRLARCLESCIVSYEFFSTRFYILRAGKICMV